MEIKNIAIETVTSAGGTYTVDLESLTDGLYLIPDASPTVLAANVTVNFSGTPRDQQVIVVGWGDFTLGGNSFTINGVSLTSLQCQSTGALEFYYLNGAWVHNYIISLIGSNLISADILADDTLDLLKIKRASAGKILVWNASTEATATTVSGDVTINSSGVTAIGAGVIVNADVNASAAIARTKLASGSNSHVLINDGSGVMSSEAQLAASRGGNGQDFSASTGFQLWNAGTASVTAISEIVTLQVSFESGYAGDFKIQMPYAGTVTGIYAYAIKVIAGTDDGTITAKNNAGTTMTDGVVTFTAADPRGTAYSVSPSASNTFIAGDILTFTTAKTTAGGVVQLSITVTRTS